MKPIPVGEPEKIQSHSPSQDAIPGLSPSRRGLWDKTEALERLGGDEDLLRELCQIFVDESPKLLQKLRQGIADADADAVMRAAHGLKGELGYLGAPEATDAARELEDMGSQKNLSRAAEVFPVLDREFAALYAALKECAGVIS
jgi:two-component system, sensor histidine kinase and response regulator